ncbi:Hypothetical protein J6896_03729 [Nakaseomyces glabratus]
MNSFQNVIAVSCKSYRKLMLMDKRTIHYHNEIESLLLIHGSIIPILPLLFFCKRITWSGQVDSSNTY